MKSWTVCILVAVCAGAFAQTPPPSADKKQMDKLQADYSAAKQVYKKSPSAKTKAQLVVATDRLATATMTTEVMDPKTRYPRALGLYQEALNLDPANNEASNNAAIIDSVYKGLIAKYRAKVKANPNDKDSAATLARYTSIYSKIHRPLP